MSDLVSIHRRRSQQKRTCRPDAIRPAPDDGNPEANSRAASGNPENALERRAWEAVAKVVDPELPVLTIADLGILRGVEEKDGTAEVTITPTYSGCPAMSAIVLEVEAALAGAGIPGRVRTVLSPAWTTDWISAEGRARLAEHGIAPPAAGNGRRALFGVEAIACPRCGSTETAVISEFGSTACKALWRCGACREPFDYFKCH